jgi:hypothetical protein
MSTIDTLPDPDLDDLYTRLHRAGVLDDARRLAEPFCAFYEAYSSYQIHLRGDPKVVEAHRQAALTAAPAVEVALGASSATVVNNATTIANDDPKATAPQEQSVENKNDASPATPTPKLSTADASAIKETPAVPEPTTSTTLAIVCTKDGGLTYSQSGEEADAESEIIRLHNEIGAAFCTSLDRAIRIGELLAQQKEALGHGKFASWIKANLPFTERTAQNYMRVFSKRAELKNETVSDLTKAYRLTAPRRAKPRADTKKAKGSEDKGSTKSKPNQDTGETTATTGERTDDKGDQTHADDRPKQNPASEQAEDERRASTTASTSSATSNTGEKPTSTQTQDEQPSSSASDDTSSSTESRPAQTRETGDANTSTKPDATSSNTPSPKLTVKQVIDMTVNAAAKRPTLGPDIIYRTAEAARIEVVIIDAVTRDAAQELARLLLDKLGDLAANDYQDACELLTSIVEDFWQTVNVNAPDSGERDEDDNSDDYE